MAVALTVEVTRLSTAPLRPNTMATADALLPSPYGVSASANDHLAPVRL